MLIILLLFPLNQKSLSLSDLPHRYSVFGASELVKVSSDATIPVRMVNPSAQPVKIFE